MKAQKISILLISLGLLAGCSRRSEHSSGVELVLSTSELSPGTTFELRFEHPIERSASSASRSKNSPLVFSPPLFGTFAWTSSRGGIFTPGEPMKLGTEYELSLGPGLFELDGQVSRAVLRRCLRTPDFGVAGFTGPQQWLDASSIPAFHVWFNANVAVGDVVSRAAFLNADGLRIPATVRQAVEDDHDYNQPTWERLFHEHRAGREVVRRTVDNVNDGTNEIPNRVVIEPQRPLAAGHGWKLVIQPGVRSRDGVLISRKAFEAPIGEVKPFVLVRREMHNYLRRGPFLELEFSKQLEFSLTNSFTNYIKISPLPENLRANIGWRTLSLFGDWERGEFYTVDIRRGVPAEEPVKLSASESFIIQVPGVPPRLYFPAFSTEQFAGGRRQFPLLAINVDHVHLRAKLLEPGAVTHALRGYQSYLRGVNENYFGSNENYHRVDYELMPGRTIFNEQIQGTHASDVAEEIKLNWDQLLAGRRTGVVFIEAAARCGTNSEDASILGAQSLIQLTDLGLVWKTSSQEQQVFVFSYETGKPVSGARVQMLSEENELLDSAVTDAEGRGRLAASRNGFWLTAQSGEDFHAVRVDEHNIPLWMFDLPQRWQEPTAPETRRSALFTDRDVYSPTDTVNLKAVVRDLTDAGLTIPAGVTGMVTCTDSRGREFFTTNVMLSELGSCELALALAGGPRGSYTFSLNLAGCSPQEHSFNVADYQPAAFEILLTARSSIGPDDKLEVPVSAHYFFGKQLSRAKLSWSLEACDQAFQAEGFEKFSFSRAPLERQWGCGAGNFVTHGEASLSQGSNSISAEIPLNLAATQPRAISLLAEVTDINQQTITRSVSILKHSSEFYVGLKQFQDVVESGKALPIELAAVGASGKPWAEEVKAKLKLQRVDWLSTRLAGAGRSARYRSEAVFTNVFEREVQVGMAARDPGNPKIFKGAIVSGIAAPGPGEYLLSVEAADARGHETSSSTIFYVSKRGEMAWNYRNEVELKIVPDKSVYAPGESALLLLQAPISGTAWVTVEGSKVLRSFTAQLEGNAPSIRVPLEASDAPNAFVSVTLVRGAESSPHRFKEPEYRVGYCQLAVEDPATRLHVEVETSVTNCLPGEIVTAVAHIMDAAGQPATNAEVTLYAVDEGVLSLTDYVVPDLHSQIFAARSLEVKSGISLPLLLTEDPDKLEFHNKGYLGGGGGHERLRQRFLACAFWKATLRSDAKGEVSVSFVAPDSITRYKVIAVAHCRANQFGSEHTSFTVSKPLMIEPALPRFARLTDEIRARAVVLNQTEEEGDVLVSVQLDAKAKPLNSSNLIQKLTIAAHGSAIVDVPVTFEETGASSWIWRARFLGASESDGEKLRVSQPKGPESSERLRRFADSVRSTLEINELMPVLREVQQLRVAQEETNLLHSIDPQVLEGQGEVKVTIANTRIVTLGEALSQLLHYPFGCVEQSSSSLLPWLLLQETPELTLFTGRDTNEAPAAVGSGIQRLFSMQTASGGLSYWPGQREPFLWGSAYAGFVLALARQSGAAVPDKEFDRLMKYLSEQLRGGSVGEESERCLILCALALAGKPEPAYVESLFKQRQILAAKDRALLALAIGFGQRNDSMIGELLERRSPEPLPKYDPFECKARTTAIELLAWTQFRPESQSAVKLAQELGDSQKHGHWFTTQGNAWALLALHHYFLKTEGSREPASGTMTWGMTKAPFEITPGKFIAEQTFPLNAEVARMPLLLARTSGSPLYVQVVAQSRSTSTKQLQEDHGIGVTREYQILDDDNQPHPIEKARVGERVLVTLRISVPESMEYIAVDDPLPGVLEALNSQFKTQQIWPGTPPEWIANDTTLDCDFRENRAGHMLFFADYVARGTYSLRYVARVKTAGTVTAPSAKAEAMYHPDRFGLTDTSVLKSEAGE